MMTDQLPLSVQGELAEARANADRLRRLEAELRDALQVNEAYAGAVAWAHGRLDALKVHAGVEGERNSIARLKERMVDHLERAIPRVGVERDDTIAQLEQVTRERESARNERDALQAKLDGASKVIAEMAANRDRLQAELQDTKFALALEQEKRRHAEASSSAQAFDGLKRKLDAALREAEELRTMVIDGGEVVKTQRERIRVLTSWEEAWANRVGKAERERGEAERQRDAALREVAILREAQRLVPRDLEPKHPACDCAKLPRVHAYDPRSCTAAGDESMRRYG